MEKRYPIIEAESICYEIECGLRALDAIQDAMESGPLDPTEYIPAIYCVRDYIRGKQKSLRDCIGAEITNRKDKTA